MSVLPWDDLQFWYTVSPLLSPKVKVIPMTAHLKVMAVSFDDLHKIRAPVGICEGLDLRLYDEMIEVSDCVLVNLTKVTGDSVFE